MFDAFTKVLLLRLNARAVFHSAGELDALASMVSRQQQSVLMAVNSHHQAIPSTIIANALAPLLA